MGVVRRQQGSAYFQESLQDGAPQERGGAAQVHREQLQHLVGDASTRQRLAESNEGIHARLLQGKGEELGSQRIRDAGEYQLIKENFTVSGMIIRRDSLGWLVEFIAKFLNSNPKFCNCRRFDYSVMP